MKFALQIVFIIQIVHLRFSHQTCRSSVALTMCTDEALVKSKPLRISDYRDYVSFEDGRIDSIPADTFKLLNNIKILQLSRNIIKKLEEGSFNGLGELQQLNLYGNKLSALDRSVFYGCDNLKILNLGMNEISDIHSKALANLVNLEELNLSFNKLNNVPQSVNALRALKILLLNNNLIQTLNGNSFYNLNNLLVLDLSKNHLRLIKQNAFEGLDSVKELNLKSNYLVDLNIDDMLGDLLSVSMIKIGLNSFSCDYLEKAIRKLNSRNIVVASGVSNSRYAVNGISCRV